MKNIIMYLVFLFSLTLHANLVEEVDKLSPEEARLVLTKLKAKMFEPVPEPFFTSFTLSGSFGTNYSSPSSFNDSINNAHGKIRKFYYGDANLLWKITKSTLLGFVVGGMGNFSSKEISQDVFQRISIGGINLHIGLGYIIDITNSFAIVPLLSTGLFAAGASIETSDDVNLTTYTYSYFGFGMSGRFNLAFMYRFNPVWSVGLETAYLYARVNGPKRSFVRTVSGPSSIVFNGGNLGFIVAYNY